MRIPSDEGGMIPAADFIAAADRIGLLHKLDQLLIEKAFRAAADYGYQGQLFINITPRSFTSADFFPKLRRLSKQFDIDPQRAIFAVIERDTVRNATMLQKFMTRMKSGGYRFAINDFGSGHSSFKYLKLFPVDFLKIEGEFVRNILNDREYFAYTKSIVTLARELGIRTVAEFIEEERIIEVCRDLGVDYGQGHYIGRPATGFTDTPAHIINQPEPTVNP